MNEFILLLVILNPFAQVLFLFELFNKLTFREFLNVHLKAAIISLCIFILFALIGEKYIMKEIFHIRLASLQIFGGIIILFIAFRYIIYGASSNLLYTGNIAELATKISLPYMIGPGTLWVSILIGEKYNFFITSGIIAGVLVANFIFMMLYYLFHDQLNRKKETAAGKYVSILMRTNALFIGAIGVEMLVTGIESILIDLGLIS
jgi:multiple antibiotic resistance protein